MNLEEIIKLVNAVSDSALTEFFYEDSGYKISLKKEKTENIPYNAIQTVPAMQTAAAELPVTGKEAAEAAVSFGAAGAEEDSAVITSPLVGTFYTAPSPDSDPYVREGDHVTAGQTVAIVEAMKLMNEIESDIDGTIEEVLAENGMPVEYGQPLFRVRKKWNGG